MDKADPYLGVIKAGDYITAAPIWDQIHKWAVAHLSSALNARQTLDNYTLESLQNLQNYPVESFFLLNRGLGMTVYGAVALSWCKDARIEQVWDGWEASGFPLKPLPEYERPARFINPALLPKTSSLAQIIAFSPDKTLPICAMIAALKEPLVFDLPADYLKNANPQIASFLKSRMEQRTDRTPEQDDLISIWTQTTKGTEWEI